MKIFVVAFLLVGSGFADFEKCKNLGLIVGIKLVNCCPGLPVVFADEAWAECKKECSKTEKKTCCVHNCVLKHAKIVDDKGKFDATLAKTVLKAAVKNDESWKMDSIVDHCIENNNNHTKSGKKITCDILENIGITDCITRQNIFDCPKWVKSDNCDTLMDFAKTCPQYPMMISGGTKRNGTRKATSRKPTTENNKHE